MGVISGTPDALDHTVQLCQYLIPLLQGLLSLDLSGLQILLQLPDHALLILLAIVQTRKHRNEVLDLLLLRNDVARQLGHASLEFVGGERVDWIRSAGGLNNNMGRVRTLLHGILCLDLLDLVCRP